MSGRFFRRSKLVPQGSSVESRRPRRKSLRQSHLSRLRFEPLEARMMLDASMIFSFGALPLYGETAAYLTDGGDGGGGFTQNDGGSSDGFTGGTSNGGFGALLSSGETEPNNTQATGNFIAGFGTGPGDDTEVDISGSIGVAGDDDFFLIDLEAGDIIGANVTGAANRLRLFDPGGTLRIGSTQNLGTIYPDVSPLPSGGNANLSYVVETAGTYAIAVDHTGATTGAYTAQLRVFRPVLEQQPIGAVQTLFIDFDGATFNRNIFGASSMTVTTSPLSSFLTNWGLTAADEDAVIDAILGVIEFGLSSDIRANGLNGDFDTTGNNGDFDIQILNSRDHADPFGMGNVSRVIIGGTIGELGIATLGIAESIDVGNFDTTETCIVLLDSLSAAAGGDSINSLTLGAGTTIIDAIGAVVGNIASHEAGHFFSNFHTENTNAAQNIQDRGGNGVADEAGVGPNNIFENGGGDDQVPTFGVDVYSAAEGLTGSEDTRNSLAFSLSTGTINLGGSRLFGAAFSGSNGLANLFAIDPITGAATLIGPIGFERVSAMDFGPDGRLYATAERADGSNTPVLIIIDTVSGAGTEVGPLGGGATGAISDISFRNADGVLFAYDANAPQHTIFTIDIQTGAATLLGDTGLSNASGNAMSFDLNDTLFHSQLDSDPTPELNTIDQNTGAATFVRELGTPPPVNFSRFAAMDAQPAAGILYAIYKDNTDVLAIIDPATGNVTLVGQTAAGMDALAWSQITLDFGDVPASYGTLLAADGARHTLFGAILGTDRDSEADGLPSADALGDDNDNLDDEDGLVDASAINVGQTATISVTVSNAGGGDAQLDAFIDFNRDGDFDDAGERVTPLGGATVVDGANLVTYVVPANATVGRSFMRLRISEAGGLGPNGEAADGEVEDYAVVIENPIIVTGEDEFSGGTPQSQPEVRVIDASTGALLTSFLAYEADFTGGVRVAVADVTGDDVPDIITARGAAADRGSTPQVNVFQGIGVPGGIVFNQIASFFATTPQFTGGLYVAAADISGDGQADIIVGLGDGEEPLLFSDHGPPLVQVIDGAQVGNVLANGRISPAAVLSSFFAFSPGKLTGVRVAAADVNLDGTPDIIAAQGPGGQNRVRVFDGTNTANQLFQFKAGTQRQSNGAYVSGGDVNNDGFGDVIVGQGGNPARSIRVFSGATGARIAQFQPFGKTPGFNLHRGIRVATTDVDNDGVPDVLAGTSRGFGDLNVVDSGNQVKAFNLSAGVVQVLDINAYPVGHRIGLFVAGSASEALPGGGSPIVAPLSEGGDAPATLRTAEANAAAVAPATNDHDAASHELALAQQSSETSRATQKKAREAAFAQESFWLGM